MTDRKKEFTGKEIADAIRAACDSFRVPQEQLDIEVLDTGSTGIFGLIRKKARIQASLKSQQLPSPAQEVQLVHETEVVPPAEKKRPEKKNTATAAPKAAAQPAKASGAAADLQALQGSRSAAKVPAELASASSDESVEAGSLSQEELKSIEADVSRLVELMGMPSQVVVTCQGQTVECSLTGDFDQDLVGPEGKTIDSIQYLLRKIVARRYSEKMRITINAGDFRERRLDELKALAVQLAAQVKADGKTQIIPALNPSERREIHILLQDEKDVRSRSVGEGLFKRVLIYKPGRGKGRGTGRSRKGAGREKAGEQAAPEIGPASDGEE